MSGYYKDNLSKFYGEWTDTEGLKCCGETPKSRFKIGKISSDIRAFYGFGNADKYYHFNKIQKENRFNAWIQESVIPIAVNAFGDYVMIGIGNDNKGHVQTVEERKLEIKIFLSESQTRIYDSRKGRGDNEKIYKMGNCFSRNFNGCCFIYCC